ncbi:MAG: alpha/beta hydrolase [Chloroflexi bacterium]|nr:alpha/beta hydrolase [Chloroflexota bacterium]MBT3670170.1 alpha/beta hydrolase [Chloroflexota bacterium]MBT4004039.1 alpha/beta hydrolase [Chloroflexota bacterium]MBT4306156.1 alpha/beta hydrolase [Chloroflexota bacterium]MBT4534536.1 alpha/beta hydrolase [Chloroflexota bacterium]
MILIHGFFYDTHLWDNNIDQLAKKYKVYAMDLWGFGYSSRENLDFGYPLYTRQLRLFMDALKIKRATLIGQSMGGGTIVKFAISTSERVDKVVLVDPAILPNKLPIMGKIANLPIVGELLFGANINYPRKMTLGNTFIHNKKHITAEYFEKVTRFQKIENSTEILLAILRKQFFHTLGDEVSQLGKIELPKLIVAGRQSAGIPTRLSEKVHQILKGSQLEILDDAGHCPNDEQSEKFNELVLAFLAS